MKARSAGLLLVLACLAPACGGGGSGGDSGPSFTPADPTPPAAMTASGDAMARAVLDLVNEERVDRGLSPLTWSDEAARVAFRHSWDMAARGYFAHVDPDGKGPGDRLAEAGVTHSGYGENIAAGQPDAASVMVDWMNSEGHRENILHPDFTHLGVGVYEKGEGAPFWTQVFLVLP